MINGHGDDIFNFGGKIKSNFSSNIPRRDLSALKAHLSAHLDDIGSYPEPDAGSLCRELAAKMHIAPENICVTNGATEAIYLIAQAYQGAESSILIPTFREYEDACSLHNHRLHFIRILQEADMPSGSGLLWLCNPNNPTGEIHAIETLRNLLVRHPQVLFVMDQSYAGFTGKELFSSEEVLKYPNLMLIHSMTKDYSIPGLRLGYVMANNELIERVAAFRMPWSVNQLAIEAGKFLLSHISDSTLETESYLKETELFISEIEKLGFIQVFPTETNFFLCRLSQPLVAELKIFLAETSGILIRDASNFRGLDNHYFRLATQSQEENQLLIKALKKWNS